MADQQVRAGIPISDGFFSRLVILLVGLAIGIWFVLRYADRVKQDPARSVVHDLKDDDAARFRVQEESGVQEMTGRHKATPAIVGLAFA